MNPVDAEFSAGLVVPNEKPPLALSDACVFAPKANPPLVLWLVAWFCCPKAKLVAGVAANGEADGDPKPVPAPEPNKKPDLPGICNCGSDCGLALPPLASIPPPRVGLSSMRIPSSADGGVRGRADVGVPNEKAAGFDVSDGAVPGVPNENPLVLVAGLVSDWAAGEPNKSPLGVPVGVVEPNMKPLDVGPDFSAEAVE